MLLATKKAAELVAAAAMHTHAEQPPCEATGHDPPTHLGDQPEDLDHGTQSGVSLARFKVSALSTCVKDLMGTGNDSQERVYTSSGEDMSDASGERGNTGA